MLTIETDDAWARDVGPTCVVDDHGTVRGVDWQFNAWGGTVDGLYAHWEKDNAAARAICAALGMDCYDAQHFVLEGGSIHSDGEGTILATEACLLSRGRNPELSRAEIEQELKNYLGAQKIVWLPGASTTTRPTSMWTTCAPMWVRQRWCWRGRRTKTTRSMP